MAKKKPAAPDVEAGSNPVSPAAMKVTKVKLDDLLPDSANVRLHPDRNQKALSTSLQRFGAARSLVVDGNGVVRAGNGTLEAAAAAGIKEAIVVETDGKQVVVVKRPDWTDAEALAYAIADNKTNELSEWDYQGLGEIFSTLNDMDASDLLDATGFADYEIDTLMQAEWKPPETGDMVEVSETHTVVFSEEQWEVAKEAIAKLKESGDYEDIPSQEALTILCGKFIQQ